VKDPNVTKPVIGKDLDTERLKVLGHLAAGVAHELNNCFFVIKGFSELARLDLPSEHPITENLDRIEETIDRADALTRMVLECAHPSDSGVIAVQLHPLVKEAVKLVRERLPDEIRIHQAIATDAAAVAVDPVRFFPMVMTLLKIATEPLVSDGDRLWVSLAETDAGGSIEGSRLVLIVGSATGEDGEEIWRRLATGDGASTAGTPEPDGAAESIHEIVEAVGGELRCRSIDQRGLWMEVSLPTATNGGLVMTAAEGW